MLTQAYIFSLGQQVKEKLVTIAKCFYLYTYLVYKIRLIKINLKRYNKLFCMFIVDGIKPNLICTSLGGKVFIHSPHDNTKDTSSELFQLLIIFI